MVEQSLQMGADFIEAQGMMAFVVVILAVLMYRDQTSHTEESKRNAGESKQVLKILREEVSNNTALINKVDQLKTDLITEVQSISESTTTPIVASIDAYAQNVKRTGDEIMATITPLEQSLADIRNELQQLRESVDAHLKSSNEFRNVVTAQTLSIENRLLHVEKRATQETPEVKPDTGKEGKTE